MSPTTDDPLKSCNPSKQATVHEWWRHSLQLLPQPYIISSLSHGCLTMPRLTTCCRCWFCAADSPKPSLSMRTPVSRRGCRTGPDSVKPIGWQKQEEALWPSHPSPMPAVLQGLEGVLAKASPDGAVLCPPCGAARAFRAILLLTRSYMAGAPSFLLQLQYQGKYGRAEREKSKKLCSCLPTNFGLRGNWFWFHVETQSNITESRYFSRLTPVYFSLAIMIHTKLLRMFQGPVLWSLLYLIF